ncbi:hypothetical protein PG991_010677 [Apiospora marii]|uniref:Uncharacterized protein n=1 Tax=Apiospora marii TaxID=335849 RepID=A0ABR1RBZ0_9PEZI
MNSFTRPKRHNTDRHAPDRRHHPARRRPQHLVPRNDTAHAALHDLDDEVLLVGDAEHVRLLLGHVRHGQARVVQISQSRGRGRVRVGLPPLDLPRKGSLVRPREEAPRRRPHRQRPLDVAQLARVRVRVWPAAERELEEEGAALPAAQARGAAGAQAQLGDLGAALVARLAGGDGGRGELVGEGRDLVGLADVGPEARGLVFDDLVDGEGHTLRQGGEVEGDGHLSDAHGEFQ